MKKIILSAALCLCCAVALGGNIVGRVICNGQPVNGVPVSDGRTIVLTDRDGRYSIDSDKSDGAVFVITPSGYIVRTLDGLRPGF